MNSKALILLAVPILLSCSKPATVTITDGLTSLTYDCRDFKPQARTNEDTLALLSKSAEVLAEASDKDDMAFYRSLRAARQIKDARRVEELIVQYECAKLQQ